LDETYGGVGATGPDLEEGRHAAGVDVEVRVELNGGLNLGSWGSAVRVSCERAESSRERTALMICVSGAIVCSRVANSDWVKVGCVETGARNVGVWCQLVSVREGESQGGG